MPIVKQNCIACATPNWDKVMVTTRVPISAGTNIRRQKHNVRCVKEAMTPSITFYHPRAISSPRVAELPSLRYTRISQTNECQSPVVRRAVIPEQKYVQTHTNCLNGSKTVTNRYIYSKPGYYGRKFERPRATRRVRFDLSRDKVHATTEEYVPNNVDANDIEIRTQRFHISGTGMQQQHQDIKNPHHNPTSSMNSTSTSGGNNNVSTTRRDATNNTWLLNQQRRSRFTVTPTIVQPTVHQPALFNTDKCLKGILSPTSNCVSGTTGGVLALSGTRNTAPSGVLLKAARDCDEYELTNVLKRALLVGLPDYELNATDSTGRTPVSYIVSNGSVDILEAILQVPGVNVNLPDNEGNTPLHFAAQAGQVECLNFLVSRCPNVEIDARNHLGFTPLMKAALQGRNKCAKLLLFAGASPTLRDSGRGMRAEQWARFCGRYVCAELIEKFARHRLLDRTTTTGRWGSEPDIGARVLMGKVPPNPPQQASPPIHHHSNSIKNRIRKVFRTSSGPGSHQTSQSNHSNNNADTDSSRLVSQLTSAALCASTPVLPNSTCSNQVPPAVKSMIRPLTVPKLQVTLVNNNGEVEPTTNLLSGLSKSQGSILDELNFQEKKSIISSIIKPTRVKKKK